MKYMKRKQQTFLGKASFTSLFTIEQLFELPEVSDKDGVWS